MEIKAIKATKDNLGNFGKLLSKDGYEGLACGDYSWYADVATADIGSGTFGVVEAKAGSPLSSAFFEAHNQTVEVLCPSTEDYLVILAEPDAFVKGKPLQAEKFAAYIISKGQGLIVNPGVWHRAPISLGSDCDIVALFKAGTSQNDAALAFMHEYSAEITVTL